MFGDGWGERLECPPVSGHLPRLVTGLSIAVALALASPRAAAGSGPDTTRFFYRGRDYGSEALISPMALIVNGGWGILQLDNRDKRLIAVDYDNGATNLWYNIRQPLTVIRETGWWDFIQNEVLPFSTDSKDARYWPNYTQHLIGGGMTHRMMVEWFRAEGYPNPTAWSVATMVLYHGVNEVVENDYYVGYTTDPIADLYLFDPLGMLLFSSPGVCGFFSNTLRMADWSYQPAWNPSTGTLENNGQNFVVRYQLGQSRWSLFDYFGVHSEFGLSYARDDGSAISVGMGLRSGELLDLGDGVKTVDLVPSAGLFYDRDNSLMFSLLYASAREYTLRANVYPGLVRLGPFNPGFFAALHRRGGLTFGFSFGNPALPLGVAFGR